MRNLFNIRRKCHRVSIVSKRFAKPQNTYETININRSLEEQRDTRKSLGHSPNAITAAKGGKKFRKYRSRILDCHSIHEIDSIIQSKSHFDVKVYTAAIKRAGMLRDVFYCKTLMDIALNHRKLTPDTTLYSTLFHAFNLNYRPLYCDAYYQQMTDVYNLKPDIIVATSLLGGCTKNGDTTRAENIWNDVIIKHNLTPSKLTFVELIQSYGQSGDCVKARQWYDRMIQYGIEPDSIVNAVMIKSYLRNNRIDEALALKHVMETNGQLLNLAGYMPLMSFYLKEEYLDPGQTLKLVEECQRVCNLPKFTSQLVSLQCIAHLKLLQKEKNLVQKKVYFDVIDSLSSYDVNAHIFLEAYLDYYGGDVEHNKIVECFERFCLSKQLGYWYHDKVINKWIIDVHGYNYETVKFVLHYIMHRKAHQLIKEMNYDWIVVCGKGYQTSPMSKDSQIGLRQYIMDVLQKHHKIRCSLQLNNTGRLQLYPSDVHAFVQRVLAK
eukprot:43188_1